MQSYYLPDKLDPIIDLRSKKSKLHSIQAPLRQLPTVKKNENCSMLEFSNLSEKTREELACSPEWEAAKQGLVSFSFSVPFFVSCFLSSACVLSSKKFTVKNSIFGLVSGRSPEVIGRSHFIRSKV